VHFKECAGTYEQEFDRMVKSGAVSLRGLKADAKVFDEFIFDVNTAYFEEHGGYDFAKEYFSEAYKLAVKEAGGEEYILSAVMHADERNKEVSDRLGRDVFHYHLHVIYLPVVDKDVYYRKDHKDPELAGKLRESIKQVSHSKKWPRFKDDSGKWVNEYSRLQDRYHEHMKAAGFIDFERGERGSTAEHLSVLEYKTQQEVERAAALAAVVGERQEAAAALDIAIEDKTQAAADLDKQAEGKKTQLDSLEKKTAALEKEAAEYDEIDRMGTRKTTSGNISVTPDDWKKVSGLATEGVKSRGIISKLKEQISAFFKKITGLEKKLEGYESKSITEDMKYYQARSRAPRRMVEVIADVMRQPPEQERTALEKKKQHDINR
jgi:hypothetical protein